MNITKETFLEFLKENDFYEGWMRGYNLDNQIYDNTVPLDDFFSGSPVHLWLYLGVGCLVFSNECSRIDSFLKKRWDDWRKKYLNILRDLDEKWMRLVEENTDRNE